MSQIGIYTYFPPYVGGGERYIMTFANALQDEHDVSFLCSDIKGYQKLSEILKIDLSKVRFIEFHGNLNYKKYLFNNWFKKHALDYDVFVAMTNHIYPPTIGLGKKNILHIQFPYPCHASERFNPKRIIQKLFNQYSYNLTVVNSQFTKSHVAKKVQYLVEVIHPPVEVKSLKHIPYQQKKNQIISVGRFIGTKDSKCQLEMVQFFKKMHDSYPDLGIQYLCVGGERPEKIHQDYLKEVTREAQDYPIHILTDITIPEMVRLYSESKIFWHGKGYRTEHKHPEYTEHFGISTVEAMASGCIPVVYKAGGQLEIVKHGFNGYLWESGDELIQRTVDILTNPSESLLISENAHIRSEQFSLERFSLEVKSLINNAL